VIKFLRIVRPTLPTFSVAPITATLLGLNILSNEGRYFLSPEPFSEVISDGVLSLSKTAFQYRVNYTRATLSKGDLYHIADLTDSPFFRNNVSILPAENY
jgi:hypothetical protein